MHYYIQIVMVLVRLAFLGLTMKESMSSLSSRASFWRARWGTKSYSPAGRKSRVCLVMWTALCGGVGCWGREMWDRVCV